MLCRFASFTPMEFPRKHSIEVFAVGPRFRDEGTNKPMHKSYTGITYVVETACSGYVTTSNSHNTIMSALF